MKIQVLRVFRDKFDGTTMYQPGEVHEFDAERAVDLITRGLGVSVEEIGEIGITGELGIPGEIGEPGEPEEPIKDKPAKGKK